MGSSALPVRAVLGRSAAACQVPRRVNEAHVRETPAGSSRVHEGEDLEVVRVERELLARADEVIE